MAISSARLPKTDNNRQAFAAKVQIRRAVLDAIGAEQAHVFDGFAGEGEMFSAVWKDASSYTGCDLKYRPMMGDRRLMFAADNRRVLRALDLTVFTIIDLDSWGEPWEQAIIIADRRPVKTGELFGFALTEGAGFNQKSGNVSVAISHLTGLRAGKAVIPGLARKRQAIFAQTANGLARKMRCDIAQQWRAIGKTGQQVVYCGLVLRGR